MVSLNRHDHGGGEVCPGCQFKARLAEYLEQAHGEGREQWHYAVGDLRFAIHAVLVALVALEAEPYGDDVLDDDPAEAAALAISELGAEVDELWRLLMPDSQAGSDPGAAL